MWLSTAPTEPLTHWYQVRCLLQSPLFTKAGDTLSGTALLVANKRYVSINARKLQFFRISFDVTANPVVMFWKPVHFLAEVGHRHGSVP